MVEPVKILRLEMLCHVQETGRKSVSLDPTRRGGKGGGRYKKIIKVGGEVIKDFKNQTKVYPHPTQSFH